MRKLPSPLTTSCGNMASQRERIMEKTRKFQNSLCRPYKPLSTSTTDLARSIMTNERKQSALSKARSSNILKLQAPTHQRAGKTSLFHMSSVDFTHFNTCCKPTFKTSLTFLPIHPPIDLSVNYDNVCVIPNPRKSKRLRWRGGYLWIIWIFVHLTAGWLRLK